MSDDRDNEPRRSPATHRVGEDLSRLSADELRERLQLLDQEMDRLRAELSRKEASLSAAEDVFTGRAGR